ncbi:MAG: hypothetical protein ACP5P1_00755 [Acidimicrobiales bacterium]
MLTTSAWADGEVGAGPVLEDLWTLDVGAADGEVLATWEPQAASREAASTAANPAPTRVRFEAVGGFGVEPPESLVVILNTHRHS